MIERISNHIRSRLLGNESRVTDELELLAGYLKSMRSWRPASDLSHTKPQRDTQILIAPRPRKDGVGIQAMQRISLMLLARRLNVRYCHLPFLHVGHKRVDPAAKWWSSGRWANAWETFLNLGQGELQVAHLDQYSNQAILNLCEMAEAEELNCCWNEDDLLKQVNNSLQRNSNEHANLFFRGLETCKQLSSCELDMDEAFAQELQRKFLANGYQPSRPVFQDDHINVALHVRRNDVSQAFASGVVKPQHARRFLGADYYVKMIRILNAILTSQGRRVCFHVFSDGHRGEFPGFRISKNGVATLTEGNPLHKSRIIFHLRQNTFDTLYHLASSDILVPGKSTFSVLAAILGRAIVISTDEVNSFYQFGIMKSYMTQSDRFLSPDSRLDHCLEQLAHQKDVH